MALNSFSKIISWFLFTSTNFEQHPFNHHFNWHHFWHFDLHSNANWKRSIINSKFNLSNWFELTSFTLTDFISICDYFELIGDHISQYLANFLIDCNWIKSETCSIALVNIFFLLLIGYSNQFLFNFIGGIILVPTDRIIGLPVSYPFMRPPQIRPFKKRSFSLREEHKKKEQNKKT